MLIFVGNFKEKSVIAVIHCYNVLTHLPLVPHIYASMNRVSIGSDDGLSPIPHQAII